jgi:hypothetical protein
MLDGKIHPVMSLKVVTGEKGDRRKEEGIRRKEK